LNTWDGLFLIGTDIERLNQNNNIMISFLLWCILLILCWPIAIIALLLYPIVWLLLLPFRILGFAIDLSFSFIKNLFMLPFTLAGKR
jgi:hypothetical protein